MRQWGDPVLNSRAREVDRFDDDLRTQIEQMGQIMEDSLGIGLAATQVGKLQRVLVYRVEPDSPVNAVVNPEVEWSGNELETAEEGCLSLQGVLVDVERPVYVRVRAQDEHGEPITIEASGLEARVLQHEIDHLDGVLILDRTSRDQRKGPCDCCARPPRAGGVRTVYLGTSDFAAAVLERLAASPHRPALVVTRPDRPAGRGRGSLPPPVWRRRSERSGWTSRSRTTSTRRAPARGSPRRRPTW